jgi:hypothetical protein
MTQAEVGKLLAFITAVYPNIDIRDGTVEAWHELLRDLDYKVAAAAVKKVVAESEIPALPAVGKIRKAALDLQHGYSITAPEAWGMILRAVRNHGYYGEAEAMKELPPDVAQVVRWMGWREICHSDTPDVVRAQFMRMYETQEKRTRELAGLPPGVRDLVKGLGDAFALPTLPNSCEHKKKEVV